MKPTIQALPRMTLAEFADKHGLHLVVRERSARNGFPVGHRFRWYARFENTETKDGGILTSTHGNGATPEAAIRDYGEAISEQKLVIDAMRPTRREIDVPVIVEDANEGRER